MNSSLKEELNSIPLADDDPQAVLSEDYESDNCASSAGGGSGGSGRCDASGLANNPSCDSISSSFERPHSSQSLLDVDNHGFCPIDHEEKSRLISQVLELQNTLDDLSNRVDCVKEENYKLKAENQVLGQYIESLMAASSVFQSTSPKIKKK